MSGRSQDDKQQLVPTLSNADPSVQKFYKERNNKKLIQSTVLRNTKIPLKNVKNSMKNEPKSNVSSDIEMIDVTMNKSAMAAA